jgi:5'-3' exonuclease
MLGMLERGATHLGVATDHVIESFRNALWPGYKTGEGIDPDLFAQFHPLEEALRSLGIRVFAMVEIEADDAMASVAAIAARDPRVEQVLLCSPDKDIAQCVVGERVVQLDRRRRETRDERGVVERFGVLPASIPDYLALVGDSADGFPGLPGWGPKSASTVLARFGRIEDVPAADSEWGVRLRGADRLAKTLDEQRDLALLFKKLATLQSDVPLIEDLEELRWRGPGRGFPDLCETLQAPDLASRATALGAR